MEDGLLVPYHLTVTNRQGVVATLQVKILKCQLDYLDGGGHIAKTSVKAVSFNTADTRCRGETSLHVRPAESLCLSISLESFLHDVIALFMT